MRAFRTARLWSGSCAASVGLLRSSRSWSSVSGAMHASDAELDALEIEIREQGKNAMLLARKACLLSEHYRLYEATDILMEIGETQSADLLANEIDSIEAEMQEWKPRAPSTDRSVKFGLPESVLVRSSSSGLGLVSARDIAEGEVVFAESPQAVMSDTDGACQHCLRPLAPRRVLRPEGEEVAEIQGDQVEELFEQCGLQKLNRTVAGFCSVDCMENSVYVKKEEEVELDSTSQLIEKLTKAQRTIVLQSLMGKDEPKFDDEVSICVRFWFVLFFDGMVSFFSFSRRVWV
jgi:hypothetical protein